MVKPDAILVQEIKVLPAKAKIQDMVAIRHSASNSDQVIVLFHWRLKAQNEYDMNRSVFHHVLHKITFLTEMCKSFCWIFLVENYIDTVV